MTVSLWWLPISIAGALALEQAIVRSAAVVTTSHSPLSGDQTDSVTYQRSIFTPGQKDLRYVWGGLVAAGLLWWLGAAYSGWWAPLGLLVFAGATGWDLWTWERVAASVKLVSWRRGWQQSTRRVPISRIKDVHVVERDSMLNLGFARLRHAACYLALEMDDGKAIKLPRTAVIEHLGRVEDVANFVRLQMQLIEDTRKRDAADKRAEARRSGKPVLSEAERALRRRLIELRRQSANGKPE